MKPISDEIKKLEAEHVNKVHSEEDLEKRNELDKQLDSILYKHYLCLMDCESRNRSMNRYDSHEEPQPISDEVKRELDELDEYNLCGGNKRRPRLPRRRRSFRNKTHRQPRQTRRNQRRNTRRRNGRHHRTRSDRK